MTPKKPCTETRRAGGTVFYCRLNEHPHDPEQHVFATKSDAPDNSHLESSLESYFRDQVYKAGGITYKVAPTTKGLPDRMVIIKGTVHLVELKADKGSLSPAQIAIHAKMLERGYRVAVLKGRAEVQAWIAKL